MFIFLIVIHVIASLVLIMVILLQSGRGGGLSETFGTSTTSTIFGTNASTFLQRATSACAIIFLMTSLTLAVLSSRRSMSLMEMERIKQVLPPAERREMPLDAADIPDVQIPFEEKEETPIEFPKSELPLQEEPGTEE